jgi:hypothetical protein
MYTWVPFPNLSSSARVLRTEELDWTMLSGLDALRGLLWYQRTKIGRVEAMWSGHEACLLFYLLSIDQELIAREADRSAYANKAMAVFCFMLRENLPMAPVPPSWLGEPSLHASHRSRLIRLAPEYYAQRMMITPLDLEMVWPNEIGEK